MTHKLWAISYGSTSSDSNLIFSSLLEKLMEPTVQMFNPDGWAADWSDVGFNNYQNLFPFPLVGLNQIW